MAALGGGAEPVRTPGGAAGAVGGVVDFWLVFSPSVPQDCFSSVPLLAHDPDGDVVKCSFASNAAVPLNVSLDQVAFACTSSCWSGLTAPCPR